jgi:protein-L-isoaspartate O-methyltransferase
MTDSLGTRRVEWQDHAEALAEELVDLGDLRQPEWRSAVAVIPRHRLVPVAYRQDESGWSSVDTSTAAGLDLVYSPTTLVTSLRQRAGHQEAVSSSTKPDLMLRMLELLDVRDGDRVLEIGTGTGYNAALLSHRLGADRVFSVDVDPELVVLARQRLADIGYRPTLIAVDGDRGLPAHAPFDRIIATCSAPRVPWTWVEQTTPDGLLIVDLKLGTSAGNLVLLTRTDFGAQGRFTERWAGFMDMRHDLRSTESKSATPQHTTQGDPEVRAYTTTVPMAPWTLTVPWFLAHFGLPSRVSFGYQLDTRTHEPSQGFIDADDGSTHVVITDDGDRRQVTETGPVRIWDCIQTAFDTWAGLGEPGWSAFGLTVTPDRQTVWYDNPGGVHAWNV